MNKQNKMDCKTIHSKLFFYLEGSLGNEEALQVESHIVRCAGCRAFAEELKATISFIEKEKKAELAPFFYTRLKAKLEIREKTAPGFIRYRPVRILQPALFSLLLIIGIYTGVQIGQSGKNIQAAQTQEEMIPFLNEMETEPIEVFLSEQDGN